MYNKRPNYNKRDIHYNHSICIPSTTNNYSMAIEFIKEWFLEKFNNEYFKRVHINEKHILDDYRNFDTTKSLKVEKPSLAITPKIDLEYDRDKLDMYNFGQKYIMRGIFDACFFKDIEKNMFLDLRLEQLKTDFNFKIRVSSRPEQIDLYKFMNIAFRIGGTHGVEIEMDFHIPYCIILQIAQDANFQIKDDKIVNIIEFLNYVNSRSSIVLLYKHRAINGKGEFFLRIKNCYCHISTLDKLSYDDGEREGVLFTNYTIEMNCTLKIPAPKFYAYYSATEHNITMIEKDQQTGLYSIKLRTIPEYNDKKWSQYLQTDWYEEDKTKSLKVNFKEILENSDLDKVIRHHIESYIHPSIFIDLVLYNDNTIVECDIDWENYIIVTKSELKSNITTFVFFVDVKYFADKIIQINELYDNRMKEDKRVY